LVITKHRIPLCQTKQYGNLLKTMKAKNTLTRADKKREDLKKAFAGITNDDLNGTERMQIAIQMGVHVRTVDRYLSGNVTKVAFGERLLATIKEFIKTNKVAA
jgi:hypothetical protein